MMPLNYILKKCTKSQEKVIYIDNIKLFTRNEELETLIQTIRIYSQDKGMELSIEKLYHAHKKK